MAEDVTRRAFLAQFQKTRLCKFFTNNRCARGDNCICAHGSTQLEARPHLNKTSFCKDWVKGMCNLSSSACSFAHGGQELRKTSTFVALTTPTRAAKQKGKAGRGGDRAARSKVGQDNCVQTQIEREIRVQKFHSADIHGSASVPRASFVLSQVNSTVATKDGARADGWRPCLEESDSESIKTDSTHCDSKHVPSPPSDTWHGKPTSKCGMLLASTPDRQVDFGDAANLPDQVRYFSMLSAPSGLIAERKLPLPLATRPYSPEATPYKHTPAYLVQDKFGRAEITRG